MTLRITAIRQTWNAPWGFYITLYGRSYYELFPDPKIEDGDEAVDAVVEACSEFGRPDITADDVRENTHANEDGLLKFSVGFEYEGKEENANRFTRNQK